MIRNFQNIKKGLFPFINSGHKITINDDAKEKTSETTLEPAQSKRHQKTSGEYFLGSMIQT